MVEQMDVDQAPFKTLHFLKLIKDGQQKHGLRHGDYKRYSDYCGRRMRRLRKSLKFTHLHKCVPKHRSKFQYKQVTIETVTDPKFIELLIYNVEHCWARGMEFKYASEDEVHARQKFHARTRLAAALKFATQLDAITKASPRVNAFTKLEAHAYFNYIAGTFFLEKRRWPNALGHYRQAKVVYENLAKIVQNPELYTDRCRELTSTIKLCEYNCGGEIPASVGQLSFQDDALDIDKLITEAKSGGSSTDKDNLINWYGLEINVEDASIKKLLEDVDNLQALVSGAQSGKEKTKLFDSCKTDLCKTIEKLNNQKQKPTDLITYLSFLRRKVALDRYVLLLEILYASHKKPSNKTKEYLRIYTEMIGHCDELLKLPTLGAKLKATYEVKREFLKAKCSYHKARSFVDLGKQTEATLLFDRALERTQTCGQLLKQAEYAEESEVDLKKLEDDINTAKQEMEDTMAAYDKTKENEKAAAFDALPKPAPVKPSFFDLALKHLKLPGEVAEAASEGQSGEQQQGGLTGALKSFIWGSK